MQIPKLDPSPRDREYKQRSFDEISKIVHTWLFRNDLGHREMDRDILYLNPQSSQGWQSMGVLHFLGLKKDFKGIFSGLYLNHALKHLREDEQDFSLIIELLENTAQETKDALIKSLYETGKSRDEDFEEHYRLRLGELQNTDRFGNQMHSRKEQGILRGILFKSFKETKCAICHRTLPVDLMVAAHIKPRSKCRTSERKNPNVVMPICKIGCDDFFEKWHLIVGNTGVIHINKKIIYPPELISILGACEGKLCTHFNEETEQFFEFKRDSLDFPKSL